MMKTLLFLILRISADVVIERSGVYFEQTPREIFIETGVTTTVNIHVPYSIEVPEGDFQSATISNFHSILAKMFRDTGLLPKLNNMTDYRYVCEGNDQVQCDQDEQTVDIGGNFAHITNTFYLNFV